MTILKVGTILYRVVNGKSMEMHGPLLVLLSIQKIVIPYFND